MKLAVDTQPNQRDRWRAWLLLMVAIVSGASGTSALSRTQGFTQWVPSVLVILCYALCFLALTRALRVIPMSIAYAVWSGLGIVLVSITGWWLFDQPLNFGQMIGIGLILVLSLIHI
jgi:small multidrug resistance pump